MRTVAQIQADLATLDAMLGRGITRITENGRTLEMDPAAIRKRRTDVLVELSAAQAAEGGAPMVRRILTFSTKGL